jgi:hypothetical protein
LADSPTLRDQTTRFRTERSHHSRVDGTHAHDFGLILMSQLAAEGPAHPSSILTMNWNGYIMERYLVELDGDQIELLSGMVREAIKVADEKKVPELQALLSALGTMSWKAGDRRTD